MGDGFSHIESVLGVGETAETEPQAIVQSAPMPMVKIETPPLTDESIAKDLKHDYETVRKNLEENLWFEVGDLFTLTEENINAALNQRYENGAQSKGQVKSIELTDYQLRPQHLLLRTQIKGQLSISM